MNWIKLILAYVAVVLVSAATGLAVGGNAGSAVSAVLGFIGGWAICGPLLWKAIRS